MSLKTQLALVALISLLLPWAGLNYVRETELALRQNQQSLLVSVAAGISSTLRAASPQILPRATPETMYLNRLPRTPVLDGYLSDWGNSVAPVATYAGGRNVRYAGGEFNGRSYLYVEAPAHSEALTLFAGRLNAVTDAYRFDLTQPGLQPLADDAGNAPLNAYVEITERIRIEISMDSSIAENSLGISIADASGAIIARSFVASTPPAPMAPAAHLARELKRYRQPGTNLHVTNRDGWIVAHAAGTAVDLSEDRDSIASLLFRRLLNRTGEAVSEREITAGRDTNTWVAEALSGESVSRWVRPADGNDTASMIVAVPLQAANNEVHGALILKRSASARLLSSSQSLSRLALLTFAATLGTAAVLLTYAVWLSIRVRRLASAADSALAADGDLQIDFPKESHGDEIGSLSRSFARLLDRVHEYNSYLKTLSSRLSHELNTPLSVVSSSLENLSAESLSDDQARYAERAHQGVERMRTLVRTMSEATRVEQAASCATREVFDLGALMQQLGAAYQDSYSPQAIESIADANKVWVFGAPALIVQAIDKIADNAASFAIPDTVVNITTQIAGNEAQITIDNNGPILSSRECLQIFESLVTLREEGAHAHLGFGLYVARLIVEAHGGRITAQPLASRQGMRFSIRLPLGRESTVEANALNS